MSKSLVKSVDAKKSYVAILTVLIDSMKVDTNQPAIDKIFAEAMAESWREHLQDRHKVPANVLKKIYYDALDYRAKNDVRNHFSVQDMISAWFRYKEMLKNAEITKPYRSDFCPKCQKSGGYITATQNGKTIEVKCSHGK